MPNLNHRLYSAFFPIFSSQKSAFFPPFFLPNPNGQLDLRWQNARNTARRMALRTMGFLVAMFSTTRADAVSISDICPTCGYYGGAICDSSNSTTYDDGTGIGTMVYGCIYEDNRGASYPRFRDADCVSLLKSWGLCSTQVNTDHYLLYNTGLSCNSGSSGGAEAYQNATINYDSASYFFTGYTSYAGIEMVLFTTYGTGYTYACCKTDYSGASTANCCFSSNSCNDWLCGICSNGTTFCGISISGVSASASTTCSSDFLNYFSTALSTGWCDSSSGIYVEGTGALLIAQACYGDSTIVLSGHMTDVFCGVLITSCNGNSGFYLSYSSGPNPLLFANSGSAAFCSQCPDGANNNVLNSGILRVYAESGATDITGCYGVPMATTFTQEDTTGTYEVNINGNCPYKN